MKIKHLTQSEKRVILLLIIVAFLATFFFVALEKENRKIAQEIYFNTQVLAKIDEKIVKDEFSFKAISIYDLTRDKKIYGRNDTTMLPTASLLKIMTAIVAMENDTVGYTVINKESLKQLGDQGLSEGELWDTQELVKLMLISSSNDAAMTLSSYDESFVKKMNTKAQELGMFHSEFTNVTGLDVNKNAGGLSSAEDINKSVVYLYSSYKEIALATKEPALNFKSLNGNAHLVQNTNPIIDKIPNLIFSKTGLTRLAGGNLSIIFKNKIGHDVAITILGGTEESRFLDMASLVEILYN